MYYVIAACLVLCLLLIRWLCRPNALRCPKCGMKYANGPDYNPKTDRLEYTCLKYSCIDGAACGCRAVSAFPCNDAPLIEKQKLLDEILKETPIKETPIRDRAGQRKQL